MISSLKLSSEKPILIHPDGQLTINYLDTQELPLNQLHIATAVALVSKMIGESTDPEKQQLRQAQIGQYVNQLYVDTFHEWAGKHPSLMPDIQRRACAVHRWRAEKMEIGTTHLEAFAELRDRMNAKEDEALAFYDSLTPSEITKFIKEPQAAGSAFRSRHFVYLPANAALQASIRELVRP